MELKGSKTEQNLMAAFAGESQARNKYTYYAQMAREEGMEQIADIFEETEMCIRDRWNPSFRKANTLSRINCLHTAGNCRRIA